MIKKEELLIEQVTCIALDTVEMTLKNKAISHVARPGQFIHILVGNHTLRRPISIADVDTNEETITIIFKIIGSGTEQLATFKAGETLNVLGPNGNHFNLTNIDATTILLIGGGVGIPPLHFLGKKLAKKDVNIISVLGFQTRDSVFYEEEFRTFSETYIVTNDGSYGDKGFVTDVLPKIDKIDSYFSCGPLLMLRAVKDSLPNNKGVISLEERMGCGVGACLACVIPTAEGDGYRKICQDGPVFDAREVQL